MRSDPPCRPRYVHCKCIVELLTSFILSDWLLGLPVWCIDQSQSGIAAARRIAALLRWATRYREVNSRKAPATVYAAIEKRGLGKIAPFFKASEEAARRTIDSDKHRRAIHSAEALTPSSSTRSRTAGERNSCSPGQVKISLLFTATLIPTRHPSQAEQ
jgi:hypothetical protein